MKNINNINRRGKHDRRNTIQGIHFPIITRQGSCVRNDRRCHPDRRVSKIEVDENKIDTDAFDFLFSNFTGKAQ